MDTVLEIFGWVCVFSFIALAIGGLAIAFISGRRRNE